MSEENKENVFNDLNPDPENNQDPNEIKPEDNSGSENDLTPDPPPAPQNPPNKIPAGSIQEAIPQAAIDAKAEAEEKKNNPPKKEGPRRDTETGEFMDGNTTKYYLKISNRPQVEKNGKMYYADDMTECSYLTDLTPDEVKSKRAAGHII